jgi:hypothetical protein
VVADSAPDMDELGQRPSSRRRGDRFARRSGSRRSRTVTSVRGTACLCKAASVPTRGRRLNKRLRPPSGLSRAAMTASTGRLVSTARSRARPPAGVIAMPRRQRSGRAAPLVRSNHRILRLPDPCGAVTRTPLLLAWQTTRQRRRRPAGPWSQKESSAPNARES